MTKNNSPGWFLFAVGVVYPAGVIVFELIQEMCAQAFFDPMPSAGHALLVLLVPLSNFLLWYQLRYQSFKYHRLLAFLSALTLGVAACYTLIFLPLTPVAIMGIIFYGLGLLPLAPLVSLIVAIVLYRRYHAAIVQQEQVPTSLWKGLVAGIVILVILDIPSIATHQGIRWAASGSAEQSLRGIELLRLLGDEEILLRRCYDQSGQASGPLGILMGAGGIGGYYVSTAKVRQIYFRVTGDPFNTRPPPYTGGQWDRMSDFVFDADQGGTLVGGRVKGLHLSSSRIDGSISSADGVAYLEWTLEFRNDSALQREVRMQLALPPEAVTSRATLWINGEEREAAFAGRAKVTAAYQAVVRRQRDPLLVTTAGVDRLQVQAFPLPPNGGTIKFRIGISAPLAMLRQGETRLVLPAIVDRNFVVGDKVRHSIWIEGQEPLTSSLPAADVQQINDSTYRVTATIDDVVLSHSRQVVSSQSAAIGMPRWAQLEGQQPVIQSVVADERPAAEAMVVVLDGSAGTESYIDDIEAALDTIPADARVGLIVAGETSSDLAVAAWTPSHAEQFRQTINAYNFVGGQDNAPALTRAFRMLEQYTDAELLWIHLPQPVEFADSIAALEQTLSRQLRVPRTSLYSLVPGPNALLDRGNWALSSRTVPHVDAPGTDLAEYFERTLSTTTRYSYARRATNEVEAADRGSEHIARLWARDRVHALIEAGVTGNTDRAIELAATYQLVTKVSGAVVLENASQYEDNDLDPVNPNSVPTIPEPEQWILALIIFAMMLWLTRQNILRQNRFA